MNLKQNFASIGAAISIATVSGCNDETFPLPENMHQMNKSVPPEVGAKMSKFIAAEVKACLDGNFIPEDSKAKSTAALGKYGEKVDILCNEGLEATVAINPKDTNQRSVCPQVFTTENGTDYTSDFSRCAAAQ